MYFALITLIFASQVSVAGECAKLKAKLEKLVEQQYPKKFKIVSEKKGVLKFGLLDVKTANANSPTENSNEVPVSKSITFSYIPESCLLFQTSVDISNYLTAELRQFKLKFQVCEDLKRSVDQYVLNLDDPTKQLSGHAPKDDGLRIYARALSLHFGDKKAIELLTLNALPLCNLLYGQPTWKPEDKGKCEP